ncbi:MAG: PP2C family protein-serine/threonine phosphatase [Christensenellales bacterium]|jgi:serine/threonine protein phosphatase PrpC
MMTDSHSIITIAAAIITVAVAAGAIAVWLILLRRRKNRADHSPVVDLVPIQFREGYGSGGELVQIGGRKIALGKAQDAGSRETQQDSYGISFEDGRLLCVVCDGMGGMAKGEESSKLAVRVIMEAMSAQSIGSDISQNIKSALEKASQEVYSLCRGRGGTTAVVAVLDERGLSYGSVGDSRLYMLRSGVLNQLGQDHIFYYDLLKTGITPEEAAEHPESEHLTSFIGREQLTRVNIGEGPIALSKGDMILLVTDGVYRSIDSEGMIKALRRGGAKEVAKAALVLQSPTQDNLTAISLTVLE